MCVLRNNLDMVSNKTKLETSGRMSLLYHRQIFDLFMATASMIRLVRPLSVLLVGLLYKLSKLSLQSFLQGIIYGCTAITFSTWLA